MQTHLYMMCYRTEALVASHLCPEAFGTYMAVGTNKRTMGNVLFMEIDPDLRSEFLRLPESLARCEVKPDGSPKRSKYIAIYRVLEHVPVSALRKLYMVTRDGKVLGLDPIDYDAAHEPEGVDNMYVELCPATPRVVSTLGPAAFIRFMTDPANAIHVPRLLLADQLIDREDDGTLAGYLPYRDPPHIIDCLDELHATGGEKKTKTVDRNPPLNAFYRTIRRGFFVGDQQALRYFPFPGLDQLKDEYWNWWRSASIN